MRHFFRGHELKHFQSHEDFRIDDQHCDVVLESPTVIIKLDASVNLFHHMCDFVNLYASQFINSSFSKHIDILWWETVSFFHNYTNQKFNLLSIQVDM